MAQQPLQLSGALLTLTRVSACPRKELGKAAIDNDFIRDAADTSRLLLIDSCSVTQATKLICEASQRITCGLLWVIAASESVYFDMLRCEEDIEGDFLVSGQERMFRLPPSEWKRPDGSNYVALLTDVDNLRAHDKSNPRRRPDILDLPVALIAVVDPALQLCRRTKKWDPAYIVRYTESKIAQMHGTVATAVFTEPQAAAIGLELVTNAYSKQGAFFLDGGGEDSGWPT